MTVTAIVDITTAAFLSVIFARRMTDRSIYKNKWQLTYCLMLIVLLVIDALALTLTGPSYPEWLRFVLSVISMFGAGLCIIAYTFYSETLLRENTGLNLRVFRILEIAESVWLIALVYEGFASRIITFPAGIVNPDYSYPLYIDVIEFLILAAVPLIAVVLRKRIGTALAVLFSLFAVGPVLATVLFSLTDIDLSYALPAFSFLLMDEFIQKKHVSNQNKMLQEALTFTNFFLDTYVSAYYVDLDDLSFKVYKRTGDLDIKSPATSNFPDSVSEYINRDVHPDDREMLLAAVRPETMREALKEKRECSCIFRDVSGDVEKIFKLQIIRGSEENHAALAFIDITEEVHEQRDRLTDAEETRKLIESVAASYDVVYAVNMADDSYRLLKQDGVLLKDGTRFRNYSESREELFSLIHTADKERMRTELDYATIREKLKKTKSYNVEFRVVVDGVSSWHEMNVTLIDADRVALGFADRDMELTKRHLEEKRYEEYFALFLVDIDTEMLKVIKSSPRYGVLKPGMAAPYTETVIRFSKSIDAEYGEHFVRLADLAFVKKELAAEDKHTYIYRTENNGEIQWVDCTNYVTLRHDDGTPAMFTLCFSLMDSLGVSRQEMQKQLKIARDEAEEANRSKTNFLFSMSHDIRTPMNAIIGFTNMAVKHIDDRNKVLECLDKTQKSGNMLLSLINSVLEVSRIESGHATLEEQNGDVFYSFANIENTMQEMAKTKDINLSFKIENIKDRYVFADFSRCMRIFVNVISNAIKYTPEGGTVKVSCEQLGEAENGIGTYRYTVSDNGIGMSEEFQRHVFEQFAREETATVSGIQGSGLGMTVVKSFVELMNGTISVQSNRGKGTTITIVLPFKLQDSELFTDPDTGEVISADYKPEPVEHYDFSGLRVLIVEDNELNREIAQEILDEEGLIVEDADDGTTAVEILKEKGPDYYDFILMDIQMPVMDGYEATKTIREMYPDKHIPILALSANAFAEDKKKSLEAGMDDHVAKPINIKELYSAMAKLIQ